MVKFKFNGGYGALLCENCGVIIATSDRIPEQYKATNPNGDLIFCSEKCYNKHLKKHKSRCKIINIVG